MKFHIGTVEEIAKEAAELYVKLLKEKPNAVLGFATGSTPVPLYKELTRLNKEGIISFKDVKSFNLDEYVGLDESNNQSYRYFMNENLFNNIDIDIAATRVPSGIFTEKPWTYDEEIWDIGGIDMQLLGIGVDGHIGFNEPGTDWDSLTHVVKLEQSTREINSRFFNSIDEVPTHAVTMGIRTIMNARKIILMATGRSKAEIVKKFTGCSLTTDVPASILQLHPSVEIFLDWEAAGYSDKKI